MRRLSVACPAKVNLALHVSGRRTDGFHEIVTLFQTIGLWDVLHGELDSELTLSVSTPSLAAGDENLVIRAARLLQERVAGARGRGARLRLDKAIPIAAGLGGGSSDAAGALVLLDELWELRLGGPELAGLAAELGSDVPFFLLGGTALGTGRGERVTRAPTVPERSIVLGTPTLGLATAEVYAALSAPLTVGEADVTVLRLFLKFAEGNDFALATNDLERAVFGLRAELSTFRDALKAAGAESALVSGSGSTVFGIFRAGADAPKIAAALGDRFPELTVQAVVTVRSGVQFLPAVA